MLTLYHYTVVFQGTTFTLYLLVNIGTVSLATLGKLLSLCIYLSTLEPFHWQHWANFFHSVSTCQHWKPFTGNTEQTSFTLYLPVNIGTLSLATLGKLLSLCIYLSTLEPFHWQHWANFFHSVSTCQHWNPFTGNTGQTSFTLYLLVNIGTLSLATLGKLLSFCIYLSTLEPFHWQHWANFFHSVSTCQHWNPFTGSTGQTSFILYLLVNIGTLSLATLGKLLTWGGGHNYG